MSRQNLPYRETSDCFLTYNGKLVARVQINQKNNNTFMSFPGGGIDKGESAIKGAKRECMEEVGAKLKSLKHIITVDWDWFPEWADTPKRQDRYKQFRGEKVHLLVGEVKEFVKPTSNEGDDWAGKKLMTIPSVIKIIETNMKNSHENMYPFLIINYIAQKTVLKYAQII